MKSTHALLAFSLLAPVFVSSTASAQDDYDDLDAPSSKKKPRSSATCGVPKFARSSAASTPSPSGYSLYSLDFAGVVFPGTNVGFRSARTSSTRNG